jgi:hypothetical protein
MNLRRWCVLVERPTAEDMAGLVGVYGLEAGSGLRAKVVKPK